MPETSDNESDESNSQTRSPFSASISAFVDRLKSYQRAPKEVWESWDQLQGRQDSTENIFAEQGGFVTWFAYYLAKHDISVSRYKKTKGSFNCLLPSLEETPVAYRQALATAIAKATPEEVRLRIEKTRKKRDQERSNEARRAREATTMTQHRDESQLVVEHHDPAVAPLQPAHIGLAPALPAPALEPRRDTFHGADLDVASTLFLGDLFNSIHRVIKPTNDGYQAAISMDLTYHSDGTVTCDMALEVAPHMASYFAQEWFGVPILTDSDSRYLNFAKGASQVLTSANFVLRGCRFDIMHSAFGSDLAEAIMMNPVYFDEAQRRCTSTCGIKMEIPAQAKKRAVIHLSLGLLSGTQIKNRLFPQYQPTA